MFLSVEIQIKTKKSIFLIGEISIKVSIVQCIIQHCYGILFSYSGNKHVKEEDNKKGDHTCFVLVR